MALVLSLQIYLSLAAITELKGSVWVRRLTVSNIEPHGRHQSRHYTIAIFEVDLGQVEPKRWTEEVVEQVSSFGLSRLICGTQVFESYPAPNLNLYGPKQSGPPVYLVPLNRQNLTSEHPVYQILAKRLSADKVEAKSESPVDSPLLFALLLSTQHTYHAPTDGGVSTGTPSLEQHGKGVVDFHVELVPENQLDSCRLLLLPASSQSLLPAGYYATPEAPEGIFGKVSFSSSECKRQHPSGSLPAACVTGHAKAALGLTSRWMYRKTGVGGFRWSRHRLNAAVAEHGNEQEKEKEKEEKEKKEEKDPVSDDDSQQDDDEDDLSHCTFDQEMDGVFLEEEEGASLGGKAHAEEHMAAQLVTESEEWAKMSSRVSVTVMLGSIIKGVISPIADPTMGIFGDVIGSTMIGGLLTSMAPAICDYLIKDLTRGMPPLIEKTLYPNLQVTVPDGLSPVWSEKLTDHLVYSLRESVTLGVMNKLMPILEKKFPKKIDALTPLRTAVVATRFVGPILVKSITHSIAPALIRTMGHSTLHRDRCEPCYNLMYPRTARKQGSKEEAAAWEKAKTYCKKCFYGPDHVYFSIYYSGYYSTWYGDYYSNYFEEQLNLRIAKEYSVEAQKKLADQRAVLEVLEQ